MKIRSAIIVALLLVLVGFLTWWLQSQHGAEFVAEVKSPGPSTISMRTISSAPPSVAASANGLPLLSPFAGMDFESQLHELMSSANRPITFFGKIIDQEGNPIPGVIVTLQIRYMKEVGPVGIGDTFSEPVLTTGADGRFALTGAKGSLLGLKAMKKDGYEPSPKAFNGTYWYWRDKDPYQPDQDRPEIFHMWKKAGAEPLVRKSIAAPLRYDGSSTTFDLLDGRLSAEGDLRITLTRNPKQITYGQRNYEWQLTLEILNGGLIESADEQMYRAPAEGYRSKMIVQMSADADDWTDEKVFNLYLKLRNGQQYGRAYLKVLVGSDSPTAPFYITSFVNPTGSRNLEYDPFKVR